MARNQVMPPRQTFGSNHRSQINSNAAQPAHTDDIWLRRALDAYTASTTFLDTNYRKDLENSIRHFQGKHMSGSKYYSDAYKYRSKLFRPKTRSIVRKNEAATAAAFFSQLDVLSVDPEDDHDPMQKASAELRQELLNYRLSAGNKKGIPWFQICVGAMQDGNINGIICSKQFWDLQDKEVQAPLTDPMTGTPVLDSETGEPAMIKQLIKVVDKPDIKLIPIENIRFDPAAEWVDVVNSSPYVIYMEPMRIMDVRAKIDKSEWENVDDNRLMAARNAAYDTTRQARDGDREDGTDPRYGKELSDFDIVWVHENIMRISGEDMHYYTLGTTARLSEVRPLEKVYLHGLRPFVVGTVVIETHRTIPDSPVHLAKPLQKEANEIVNSRQDNVKLVLNKRYLVKRGKQVDLQSLVRNAAGSVTLVNDPQTDVAPLEFTDVTRSAYEEQNLINNDLDDLLGSFSQGSVQSNRKLNETVGGMSMLRGSANEMTQYLIRVFNETWVERVLNQLDALEQHYESDIKLLNLMGKRANIQKYGIQQVDAKLLMQPARVTVNVANSAMDPAIRLQMFLHAISTYAEISQTLPPDIDREAVKVYLFGLLGHKDGSRFSTQEGNLPPQVMQMQAVLQQQQQVIGELENVIKSKQIENQMKSEVQLQIAQAKDESARTLKEMETHADVVRDRMKLEYEGRIESAKLQNDAVQGEREREMKLMIATMQARLEAMQAMLQHISAENSSKRDTIVQIKDKDSDARVEQLGLANDKLTQFVDQLTNQVKELNEKRKKPVRISLTRGADGFADGADVTFQ